MTPTTASSPRRYVRSSKNTSLLSGSIQCSACVNNDMRNWAKYKGRRGDSGMETVNRIENWERGWSVGKGKRFLSKLYVQMVAMCSSERTSSNGILYVLRSGFGCECQLQECQMLMNTHPQCGSEKEQILFRWVLSCVFQCRRYFVGVFQRHSNVSSLARDCAGGRSGGAVVDDEDATWLASVGRGNKLITVQYNMK